MNRTLLLLLVLLGLGGLTYWMLQRPAPGEARSLTWEREFKVPADDIYKVFLYNRKTDTRTTLERRGDGWLVDGQHPVNPNIIKNFLATLSTVQLNYVPGEAAVLPAAETMATQGISVEIFGRDGEALKKYIIGGNNATSQGTYALIEGSEQPQVVSLPFFSGTVRTLYALHGDAWRDKALFDFDPAELVELTVDYPKQRSRSFVLRRVNGTDTVLPLYSTTAKLGERPAPGLVDEYLDTFGRKLGEAFINRNPRRAAVTATLPFAVFTVKNRDGIERVVKLWPQASEDTEGRLKTTEYERYFVELTQGEQTDFMAAQHRVISALFRDYGYFFGG